MRRLPDSPPRVSETQRFLILCLLGIIAGLGALWLVVTANPVSANIPGSNKLQSNFSPIPPSVETIVLPVGSAKATTAPVSHWQPPVATHGHTTAPRPSQAPVRPSAPTLTVPPIPAPSLTPAPTDPTEPPASPPPSTDSSS